MRLLAALAAFAVTGVSGCLAPGGLEEASVRAPTAFAALPRLFDGYLHESFDVPSPGGLAGVKVHLDLWRPDPAKYLGADPAGADAPVPVLVDMGPYFGDSKENPERRVKHYVHDWIFRDMIPRGYAFAAVETPGTAGSSGCWDFMGPQETAAAAAAVDWLGSEPWSNGKVGMIGKSYDGMTQIMALSQHPERLATAVPVAPLTHAYAGIYMNGVPYVGFWGGAQAAYTGLIGLGEVPVESPERRQGYVEKLPAQALCAPENFGMGVLNLGEYNAYYKARDFRPGASSIEVPVFFTQGFLDANVRADNAFPYVNDLAGPKMVWLGQWYHDYPNATWAGRDDMYVTLHRWFDRWLKGVDTGIEADLGFHVQDSEGAWRREASWPPPDAVRATFSLADSRLSEPGAAGGGARFLDEAGATFGRLPEAGLMGVRNAAIWTSEPLAESFRISGPARVELNVSTTATRGHVVAVLADCAEDRSSCEVVARGAMNLLFRDGLERATPVPPGDVVAVAFDLQPRDYVVLAGRSLALVVAGTDGDWFVPDPTRGVVTVHESADRPSSLLLPTVERGPEAAYLVACGDRIKSKPCYRPGLRDVYPGE